MLKKPYTAADLHILRRNFFTYKGPISAQDICQHIGGQWDDSEPTPFLVSHKAMISDVNMLTNATSSDISLYTDTHPVYKKQFIETKAMICVTSYKAQRATYKGALIRVAQPLVAMAKIVDLLYEGTADKDHQSFQSPYSSNFLPAYVHVTAVIDATAVIGPSVVIGAYAVVGAHTVVGAGAVIGHHVEIGAHCTIGNHVSIMCSIIEDHVTIKPHAAIGQMGFGFFTQKHTSPDANALPATHHDFSHIGLVWIRSHAVIGAHTSIDRGSLAHTIIERHVRIDNLIQIAHNVHVDCGTVMAAQTGVAGSTHIGPYNQIGGQVGFAGHISTAAQTTIAAQSGVMSTIEESGKVWGGSPALPIKEWLRTKALERQKNRTSKA